MATDTLSLRPCKICLVQHDDEIHAATISVRTWFRNQVTQGFYDDPVEVPVVADTNVAPTAQVA